MQGGLSYERNVCPSLKIGVARICLGCTFSSKSWRPFFVFLMYFYMSFKVIEVGINRKPVCDFLLYSYNWHPIWYRFGVIAAYCSNFGTLRFWATLWGLGTTYDVHLGLIVKRVVDFLLLVIRLFSPKTRLNNLSYGIKIWTDFSSLSQFTRLTDRQTDGRTDILERLCILQRGKNWWLPCFCRFPQHSTWLMLTF